VPYRDAVSGARAQAHAPDARIVREAADWLVRLDAGPLDESERRALATWRARSPEHERAWRTALELKGLLGRVPSVIGARVLGRKRVHRRTALKSLAALLVAGPAAWTAYRYAPWAEWSADYRTGTGEQRRVDLPDGSRLLLNTASAVDMVFDGTERRLILHRGETLVETAPDPRSGPRAFLVETAQGRIRALGTRFAVRERDAAGTPRTWVGVLEGAVAIRPARAGEGERVLEAGRQTAFTRDAVEPPGPLEPGDTAWTRGQIIAERQRLGDLAEEIARYRVGVLRCDPAVADLRISGVFQVNDTDRALGIIAETLPVRLTYVTRYWVSITPRE